VYYFNLVAEAYVVDDVGTALSDMAAVRRHAYAVAQELLRNNPASNAGEWRLEITDGHGGHLLTVAFSEAVQAQRGRYQESRRGKSDRAA